MDINKVFMTGVAETAPVLTTLPQTKTPLCYFTLRVEERFMSNKSVPSVRANYFRVESLGRQAESSYNKIKQGGRYLVDGYLRQENSSAHRIDHVKVRSFGIIVDPSTDSRLYNSGLEQALEILHSSKDLAGAISAIKELLSGKE
jgi:primosomal replication protein N